MKKYKKKLIRILLVSMFIFLVINVNSNIVVDSDLSNQENEINSLAIETPEVSDDFIPTPGVPNENFAWGFSNGTELGFIYERYNDTEYSSGVSYYNITSMPIIFANITEQNDTAYCVQLEEIYYNLTLKKNVPVLNTPLLNVSLVNFTADLSFIGSILDGYMFPMVPPEDGGNGPSPGWIFMFANPFIPKNDTQLAFNWSAQRLKLWYSYFLGDIETEYIDIGNRNFYFENDTTGAYVNITYDGNGIIIYGELKSYDDEDGWMTVTLTTTYDLNPLDNIEWAVNEGDLIYYGINHYEARLNITRIVNITYVDVDHDFRITLQQVVANLSWWNDYTKTWDEQFEMVIGSANEQYPLFMVNQSIPLLIPIGAKASDVYSFLKQRTGPDEDYDSAILEDDWITLLNSTTQGFEKTLFNSSGYIDLTHIIGSDMLFDEDPGLLYRKNSRIIDNTNPIWEFDISPFGTEAFNITLNISVTAESHLLTSAFNINPTNLTGLIDNYGVLFIDIWLNDTSKLNLTNNAPINVTIEFDHTQYKNMKLWYFNVTAQDSDKKWIQIPFTDLGNGVIIFTVNHTSFFAFTNIPISLLPSDGDGDGKKKKEDAIPGFDLYLLLAGIALLSVALILKRRKIIKI